MKSIIIHNRYLDLNYNSRTRSLELKLGLGKSSHWLVRVTRNMPITDTTRLVPEPVYKSTFTLRCIVHPGGGGSQRLVCEQCGTEYPYNNNPVPCANCAVPKESGLMLAWGRRTWKWSWSRWGWAVKEDGRWVVADGTMDDKLVWRPIRYTSLRRAEWARDQLRQFHLDRMDGTVESGVVALGHVVEVVLYPGKSAVALTNDPYGPGGDGIRVVRARN